MPEDYQEKKGARVDRYRARAAKNRAESAARYEKARAAVDGIPFGQPILVGHHSEGRHRAAIKRSYMNMRASIEADKAAAYWESRANAAESSNSISSDDPQACEKLEVRIAELEDKQKFMKEVNAALKRMIKKSMSTDEQISALAEKFNLGEKQATEMVEGDFMKRKGFPEYALQNNNGNLRRVKQRLESLKVLSTMVDKFEIVGDIAIVANVEANRVQIYFPRIPDEKIRKLLKSNGFRFSPTAFYRRDSTRYRKAWQCHLRNHNFETWVERVKGWNSISEQESEIGPTDPKE